MEAIFNEDEFYQDDGGPTEFFNYCHYIFYTGESTEYGPDYDQFATVMNSEYPYRKEVILISLVEGVHNLQQEDGSLVLQRVNGMSIVRR